MLEIKNIDGLKKRPCLEYKRIYDVVREYVWVIWCDRRPHHKGLHKCSSTGLQWTQ